MEALREAKVAAEIADVVGNAALKDTFPVPALLVLLIIEERERAIETEVRTTEMLKQ